MQLAAASAAVRCKSASEDKELDMSPLSSGATTMATTEDVYGDDTIFTQVHTAYVLEPVFTPVLTHGELTAAPSFPPCAPTFPAVPTDVALVDVDDDGSQVDFQHFPSAPQLPSVISAALSGSSAATVVVHDSSSSSSGEQCDGLDDIDGAEHVSDEEELSEQDKRVATRSLQRPIEEAKLGTATTPRIRQHIDRAASPLERGKRRSLELGSGGVKLATTKAPAVDDVEKTEKKSPRRRLRFPRLLLRSREAPLPPRFAAVREDASDFLDEDQQQQPPPPIGGVQKKSGRVADEGCAKRKSSLVARLVGSGRRRGGGGREKWSRTSELRVIANVPSSQNVVTSGRRTKLRWTDGRAARVAPDVKRAGSFVRNVSMAKDDFIDFATSTAAHHRPLWRRSRRRRATTRRALPSTKASATCKDAQVSG